MKIKKIILLLAVFLMLVLPSLIVVGREPPNYQIKKNLTIDMRGIDGEDYSMQIKITDEEFKILSENLNDTLKKLEFATKGEWGPDGCNISDSEWDEAENGVNCLIDLIKGIAGDDFPDESVKSVKAYIASVIKSLKDPNENPEPLIGPFRSGWRQPLFSIGMGWTLIPFYEYETFLGKLIRPVWMRHLVGFSATKRFFRFGFVYWNFGLHRAMTFSFWGILINFGDLGVNRRIGPQLLVGFGSITHFPHT